VRQASFDAEWPPEPNSTNADPAETAVSDGQPRRRATDNAPSGPLVAIRSTPDGPLVDIASSAGLLLRPGLPLEVWIEDGQIAPLLAAQQGRLLIVPTMSGGIICLKLGLAAAPATWLSGRSREVCVALERLTAPPRSVPAGQDPVPPAAESVADAAAPLVSSVAQAPAAMDAAGPSAAAAVTAAVPGPAGPAEQTAMASPTATSRQPVTLVFSGYDFVGRRMLAREQLQEMIRPLADAQRYLGVDFSGIATWYPSEETLARLDYARRLQAADVVVTVIRDSLDTECFTLADTYRGTIAPWQTPQTLLDARDLLQQRLADPNETSERIEQAFGWFDGQVQATIIRPIVDQAMAQDDPVRGGLLHQLAGVSDLLQSIAPFLRQRLVRSCLAQESRNEREQLDRLAKRHDALQQQLLRLAKELKK